MIHRLEIENFYSICETQVIDLRVGAKVPDEESRFAQIEDGSGDRVPKTVALYGANASGKSNILKALVLLKTFLVDSINLPTDKILPLSSFGSAQHDAERTRIKVHFDWIGDLVDKDLQSTSSTPIARYTYEVQFQGDPNWRERKTVLSEELRLQPISGKSRRVFERNESGEVQGSDQFPLNRLSHILTKLRPDVSLASTIAQFADHSPALAFLEWAKHISANILWEKLTADDDAIIGYYAKTPTRLEVLNRIIEKVDLGIRSFSIAQSPGGPVAVITHHGLDRPLAFWMESQGTRDFIKVFPYIVDALSTGGIAVIDELDSTIHPMLLPEILRWFHDPVENPHNAQLWFSGHSASLLEELQKEEIFFTEKDQQGRTSVYGLKDIESVRRSDNFYQKYLGGVYGAVPRIG